MSFAALAKDYAETVLSEFDAKERQTRERRIGWWSQQFAGLSLTEITADRISMARDKLAAEAFSRGRLQKHRKTDEHIPPKEFKRSGAAVNRYIAALSHALSLAVKERRLLEQLRERYPPRAWRTFIFTTCATRQPPCCPPKAPRCLKSPTCWDTKPLRW